ncbi:hypothetical protein [Oceanicaulis sp. MMSF_3324]|uniref:hypothetical protein n=1 Tax=Oceanicaulis sp. MMSF_3324 TaxID=3046702 RepID=UPI00273F0178|nr:hypothetical protein [Oceanicaulis sp. MMSF_3324]
MLRCFHPVLIRVAAALVVLQALWSPLATTAYAAGFDAAQYMCGQVALDAAARAQIAELVALTGLEEPQPLSQYDASECVACALGQAAVLQDIAKPIIGVVRKTANAHALRIDQASPRQPAGPPVGLRAPPFQN